MAFSGDRATRGNVVRNQQLSMLAILVFGLVANTSVGADLYKLEAAILNVKPGEGYLRVELHDSAATYLSRDELTPFRRVTIAADRERMILRFDSVPPGRYALSMYQDLNNNRKLDSNILGIPKEPFGFSNNHRVRFGPPSFAKASFEVTTDLHIDVELQ